MDNLQMEMKGNPLKKESRVPHVFVILFFVIVVAAISTYLLPSGEYERSVNDTGQTIVVDGTYEYAESSPIGFFDIFQSIHLGMLEASSIIFYIFIVGGAFGIFQATGAIESVVLNVSNKMIGKEKWIIPVLIIIFALYGGVIGLAEATIPFVTIMIPLSLKMGYDSMTGTAIVLVGTAAGFASGVMNPFTVGVAQSVAELPLFSGMGLRIILWIVFVLFGTWFVMRYAEKVKKDPRKSVVYEEDQLRDDNFQKSSSKMTRSHKLVLTIMGLVLVVLVIGVFQFGWAITELAGLFLLMGILMGIVSKMSMNQIAESFINGCKMLVVGALVVGIARAVLIVLENGLVIDSILYGVGNVVSSLPAGLSASSMYVFQCILNYIVPSGSGQAALTMPIMTPLSDMSGVTRQTAVLAYQLGDAISNIFTPTSGYFMAALALAKISWVKWAKWIIPFILLWYLMGVVIVVLADLMGY